MIGEIRIYKLKENSSDQFLKVFKEPSFPVVQQWMINVVDYCFSLMYRKSFYLMCNFDNLEKRKNLK